MAAIFLAGNLSDGFAPYGPYEDFDLAAEAHDSEDGWVMDLRPTRNGWRSSRPTQADSLVLTPAEGEAEPAGPQTSIVERQTYTELRVSVPYEGTAKDLSFRQYNELAAGVLRAAADALVTIPELNLLADGCDIDIVDGLASVKFRLING